MLVATFGDDIEWRCGVYHGLQLSMSGIDVLITFTGAAADHTMDEVVKPYFMYSGLNEQVSQCAGCHPPSTLRVRLREITSRLKPLMPITGSWTEYA